VQTELAQFIGGIIICIANLPQIYQIIKTKKVEGLNLVTFFLIFVGVCLMEVYAIELFMKGIGSALLITTSISVVLNFLMVFFIYRYKKLSTKIVTQ